MADESAEQSPEQKDLTFAGRAALRGMSFFTSHPTAYAVTASLALGLLYVIVWRLPFHFPLRKRGMQILVGCSAAVLMLLFFGWVLPLGLLYPFNTEESGLTFLRADFWALAFLGFMAGLFCLLPLAAWFDEQTYNSPLFQKKRPMGLAVSALLLVIVPHCIVLNAYTRFGPERIEFLPYWKPEVRQIEYGNVAGLHLDSESRTRRGNKGGTRTYYVLKLELSLKSQPRVESQTGLESNGLDSRQESRYLILETEDPNESLAVKTAALIRFLEERGIPAEVPFVLMGMENWKSRLEYHLQKR